MESSCVIWWKTVRICSCVPSFWQHQTWIVRAKKGHTIFYYPWYRVAACSKKTNKRGLVANSAQAVIRCTIPALVRPEYIFQDLLFRRRYADKTQTISSISEQFQPNFWNRTHRLLRMCRIRFWTVLPTHPWVFPSSTPHAIQSDQKLAIVLILKLRHSTCCSRSRTVWLWVVAKLFGRGKDNLRTRCSSWVLPVKSRGKEASRQGWTVDHLSKLRSSMSARNQSLRLWSWEFR